MFSYLLLSLCLVIAFCATIQKGGIDLQFGEKESKTYKMKALMFLIVFLFYSIKKTYQKTTLGLLKME